MAAIRYGNQPLFVGDDIYPKAPGDMVDVPGGKAVKKPNGKWLSLPPTGVYAEADSVGVYETFALHDTMNWFGVSYTQSDGPSAGLPVKFWVVYAGGA